MSDRAAHLYCNALAESTTKQYSKSAEYYARFCVIFGLEQHIYEPVEEVVVQFVSWLSLTNSHNSVRSIMSGVKDFWSSRGITVDMAAWPRYYRVMRGLRRLKGGTPNRKRPISPDNLRAFRDHIDLQSNFGAALWACMLVTWWGMFRKSNTTVGNANPMDSSLCIRKSDVVFDLETWSMTISVRKSKTNQFSERVHKIVIQGMPGNALDPVGAVLHHFAVNDLLVSDPVFSFHEGGVKQPMRHEHLVLATKILTAAIGLDPRVVSGHSFRRGAATYAFQAGVPDILLQYHGDWQSLCYKLYVELSPKTMAKASQMMIASLQEGQTFPMVLSDAPWGHTGLGNLDQLPAAELTTFS